MKPCLHPYPHYFVRIFCLTLSPSTFTDGTCTYLVGRRFVEFSNSPRFGSIWFRWSTCRGAAGRCGFRTWACSCYRLSSARGSPLTACITTSNDEFRRCWETARLFYFIKDKTIAVFLRLISQTADVRCCHNNWYESFICKNISLFFLTFYVIDLYTNMSFR